MNTENQAVRLAQEKRKRERLKRERQPELVLVANAVVAVQKRPRAFAGAVKTLRLILNAIRPTTLLREVGPFSRPEPREQWETWRNWARWEERRVR